MEYRYEAPPSDRRVETLESANRMLQLRVDDCLQQIAKLQTKVVEFSIPRDEGKTKQNRETLLTMQWKEVDRLEAELADARLAGEREKIARSHAEAELVRVKALAARQETADNSTVLKMRVTTLEGERSILRTEVASLKARIESLLQPSRTSPPRKHHYTPSATVNEQLRKIEASHRLPSFSATPYSHRETGDAEELIDIIKDAFLNADKKNGMAVDLAMDRLRRTEGKIAELTNENKRLQGKLDKAVRKLGGYKTERLHSSEAEGKAAAERECQLKDIELDRVRAELVEQRAREGKLQSDVHTYRSKLEELEVETISTKCTVERVELAEARLTTTEAALVSRERELLTTKQNITSMKEANAQAQKHVSDLLSVKEQLHTENLKLQTAHEATKQAHQTTKQQLTSCESELSETKLRLSQYLSANEELGVVQHSAEGLKVHVAELKGQVEVLETQYEHASAKEKACQSQVEAMHTELTVMRERHVEERRILADQLHQKEAALKWVEDEGEHEKRGLKRKVEDLQNIVGALKPKVEQLERERDAALEGKRHEEKAHTELAFALRSAESKLEQVKQTAIDTNQAHDTHIKKLEAEHERDIVHLKQETQTLKFENSKTANEIKAAGDATTAKLERDLELSDHELEHVRKSLGDTLTQLETQNRKVESLKLELEKTSSNHQRTLELEALTNKQAIEKLDGKIEQERLRASEANDLNERRIKHLLEEKESLKVENAKLTEQNRSQGENMAHLREEAARTHSSITELELKMSFEKSQRMQSEGASTRQQEAIQELKQQLAKREVEATELQRGLQQQTEAASQAKAKRTDLEEQLRDLELRSQKDRTRSELLDKQRFTELEDVQGKNRLYEEQITSVQQKLLDVSEQYKVQKKELSSMLEERRHEHDTIIDPLKETVEKQRSDIRTLKDRCTMLEGQVSSQQNRAQEMYKESTEVKVVRAGLEAEKNEQVKRIKELKEALEALRSEATALQQQLVVCDRQKKDLEVERDSYIAKLQECSSKAYDEQLTLNAALQEACKEKAVLGSKCESIDVENKRISAELEEVTANLHKSEATAVKAEGLERELEAVKTDTVKQQRDLYNSIEIENTRAAERVADLEEQLISKQNELARTIDVMNTTTADMDIMRQSLSDASAEVSELKGSNEMLKATCLQHQRENESLLNEREGLLKVGQEAESLRTEVRKVERMEMDVQQSLESEEVLKSNILELNTVISEDRKKVETLLKESKEKDEVKIELEKNLRDTRVQYEKDLQKLKSQHVTSVSLLATVLSKLHDFVQDAQGYLRSTPHPDDALLATVPATAAQWRSDPTVWSADTAQILFTKLIAIVMRSLDTLKHLHAANARSSRGSPVPAS